METTGSEQVPTLRSRCTRTRVPVYPKNGSPRASNSCGLEGRRTLVAQDGIRISSGVLKYSWRHCRGRPVVDEYQSQRTLLLAMALKHEGIFRSKMLVNIPLGPLSGSAINIAHSPHATATLTIAPATSSSRIINTGGRRFIAALYFCVAGSLSSVLGNPLSVPGKPFSVQGNLFPVPGNPLPAQGKPFSAKGKPFSVLGLPRTFPGLPGPAPERSKRVNLFRLARLCRSR